MSRPRPQQQVSFQESVPQSRRANDVPPRPPPKHSSKSNTSSSSVGSPGAYEDALSYDRGYVDAGASNPQGFSNNNGADVRRKKSMVRPERERIDPGHRLWHYRDHAQADQMNILPSCEPDLMG